MGAFDNTLDWRHATWTRPAPCTDCGTPARLRDPATNLPRHKVCAEAKENRR